MIPGIGPFRADDAVPQDRAWLTVPEAGRLVAGLGRSQSYEAVRRGDIPVIRLGRRIVVPTAGLRRLLLLDAPSRDEAPGTPGTYADDCPTPVVATTTEGRRERT